MKNSGVKWIIDLLCNLHNNTWRQKYLDYLTVMIHIQVEEPEGFVEASHFPLYHFSTISSFLVPGSPNIPCTFPSSFSPYHQPATLHFICPLLQLYIYLGNSNANFSLLPWCTKGGGGGGQSTLDAASGKPLEWALKVSVILLPLGEHLPF